MTPEECRENLIAAKKRLIEALAVHGNEKAYWANMKAWFKQRISKEEFDVEARQLLTKETTHLHNDFLLAVLTKCHTIGSGTGVKDQSANLSTKAKKNKRKMQAVKRKFDNRFIPAVSSNLLPARNIQKENKQMLNRNKTVSKQKETRFPKHIVFCSRSLEIPSMLEMNGRVAVIAWERGLDDFADEISVFVINAIHVFLKNIIADICSRRSAYKVRNSDFKHHFGCTAENPYLLQEATIPSLFGPKKRYGARSIKPTFDEAEQMAIECIGRSEQSLSPSSQAVNLYELLGTLQQNRCLIPSHSIYGLCMERIISSLWHPDHDEIEQEERFNNHESVADYSSHNSTVID